MGLAWEVAGQVHLKLIGAFPVERSRMVQVLSFDRLAAYIIKAAPAHVIRSLTIYLLPFNS